MWTICVTTLGGGRRIYITRWGSGGKECSTWFCRCTPTPASRHSHHAPEDIAHVRSPEGGVGQAAIRRAGGTAGLVRAAGTPGNDRTYREEGRGRGAYGHPAPSSSLTPIVPPFSLHLRHPPQISVADPWGSNPPLPPYPLLRTSPPPHTSHCLHRHLPYQGPQVRRVADPWGSHPAPPLYCAPPIASTDTAPARVHRSA